MEPHRGNNLTVVRPLRSTIKHSCHVLCRALRKRPHETRHYRHSDGQRRFVFLERRWLVRNVDTATSPLKSTQHDARRARWQMRLLAVARSLADSRTAIREGLGKTTPAEAARGLATLRRSSEPAPITFVCMRKASMQGIQVFTRNAANRSTVQKAMKKYSARAAKKGKRCH